MVIIDYALHCSKIITNDSHHLPNELLQFLCIKTLFLQSVYEIISQWFEALHLAGQLVPVFLVTSRESSLPFLYGSIWVSRNCPPTPPLSHHFPLSERKVLMLAWGRGRSGRFPRNLKCVIRAIPRGRRACLYFWKFRG